MAAQVGGYFGVPFKDQSSVTQRSPLSPTIINTVVNVILRHWVSLVAEAWGEAVPKGFVRDNERLMA